MNHPIKLNPTLKKKLVLTVTNDLHTDNRVHKVATSLINMGFEVTLVGRIRKYSKPINNRNYKIRRFALWFNKGPLFYANYNIRLLFYLLVKNFDVVVANDLDTLTACFVASKITNKHLVYDSHEYFTEVPELVDRPFIQKRWENIEKAIVPKIKNCYTVCESISNIYNIKYGTNFKVVRNLPLKSDFPTLNDSFTPPFPTKQAVILYQGAVNVGRGIEEAINAMHFINDACLVIIGEGDLFEYCKQLVISEQLTEKVIFTGRIPFEDLRKITRFATIGLSIEKDIGLNYRYALPNKLFDYIQSEVPVLASELPEIKRIVTEYNVGMTINETKPELIAYGIQKMLNSEELMKEWKKNCVIAKEYLCWENEEVILKEIYQNIIGHR